MQEIKYLTILKNAFNLSWKHKFLWFFGFFIFLASLIENISFNQNITSEENAIRLISSIINNPSLLFSILLLLFFTYTLRNLSASAIVRGLRNPALYQQRKPREILKEMFSYFGRLVRLDFFLSTGLLLLFFLLSIPITSLLSLKETSLATFCLILAIFIFVPLLFLAFFLRKYSYLFIVLGDLDFKNSLDFAYHLFIANARKSLLMAILSTFVIICFAGIIFLFLFLLFHFIFPGPTFNHGQGLLPLTLPSITLGLGLIILGFSFFNVFLQAIWLDFFSQISMEKISEEKLTPIAIVEDEVSIPETV